MADDKLGQIAEIMKSLTWQKWLMVVSFFVIWQVTPLIAEHYVPGGHKTEAAGHIGSGIASLAVGSYVTRKILGA